jgi:hypothetical protein
MAKRTKSANGSKRSKPKSSAVGRRVIKALDEALAHARGELALPSYTVSVSKPKLRRGQPVDQSRPHR